MAALALGCALAVYPAVDAGDLVPLTATLAVFGVLFVVLALLLRAGFTGAALFALAAEYLVTEATGSVSAFSVIFYAVGLLTLCELVFWARHLSICARVDASAVTGWLRGVALIAIASALLAIVALAATGFRMPGALTGTVVGAAAAVLLLAVPWLLVRARRDGGRGPER